MIAGSSMRKILLAIFAVLFSWPALAQQDYGNVTGYAITTCGSPPVAFTPSTTTTAYPGPLTIDANGLLCVNASVSVSGFAPGGHFATITATASSADATLPTGSVVAFQNTGTSTVSCTVTSGAGTATASENIIPPSSTVYLTIGANTHGSCIDQTGSASNVVVLSGGAGLGTGFGGGAIQGAVTVVQSTAASLNMTEANSPAILAAVQGSIPAGTAYIGHTSLDPCAYAVKTTYPVLITGTTTVKIVGEVAAQQVYICSVALIASAATVMSIADGTKTSTECDTAAHAIFGQTTATHGMSLAANGGFTVSGGNGTVGSTATAAHDVCIFQSGSGDISGNITVVQQ